MRCWLASCKRPTKIKTSGDQPIWIRSFPMLFISTLENVGELSNCRNVNCGLWLAVQDWHQVHWRWELGQLSNVLNKHAKTLQSQSGLVNDVAHAKLPTCILPNPLIFSLRLKLAAYSWRQTHWVDFAYLTATIISAFRSIISPCNVYVCVCFCVCKCSVNHVQDIIPTHWFNSDPQSLG